MRPTDNVIKTPPFSMSVYRQPKRLTYQGHEFLDTIRDGEVWRRTKAGAEKIGGASIGFIWELAKAYGKQLVTERLGFSL